MGETASRIAKSATAMMIIAMLSKLLGLIRESVTAAYFGANFQTDAYKVAFEIPSILTGVIYAAITITFIPVYCEFKNKTHEQKLYFVNNLFNVVMLITAVIAAAGMVLAPRLVRIVAPGFNEATFDLSVKLTVFLFPSIVFLALAYLANGFLQANRSFAVPASMGIPLNLIIIFSMVLFYRYGIEALTIGSLIAMTSQFLIQLPFMLKAGFRFRAIIDFKEPGLRRVLALSIPVFISTAFSEMSILIDKMLASGLDVGSISVLDYASKVNGIANGIFFASVAVVFFPELSLVSDNLYKFSKTITSGIKIVIMIAFPVTAGIWVLKAPLIRLLFERREFTSSDTAITSVVLGLYSIGIIGSGLTAILNRAFYSRKDTRTPMIIGISAICANICFSIVGVRLWGVRGLALASSSAALLSGLFLFFRMRCRVWISYGEIVKLIVKSAGSAFFMGIILYFINLISIMLFGSDESFVGLSLRLAVTIGIGVVVYIGMHYALKTDELMKVIGLISNKVKSARSKAMQE